MTRQYPGAKTTRSDGVIVKVVGLTIHGDIGARARAPVASAARCQGQGALSITN